MRTAIWPATLLFYTTLIPPEVSFHAGTFVFHGYRLALILLLPVVVYRFATGNVRLCTPDFLILALSLWMPVAIYFRYGLDRALESGGAVGFDIAMAYFVGRTTLRNVEDLRRALRSIAPALLVAGILVAVESLSHTYILRPSLSRLTGIYPARPLVADPSTFRLGLLRGTGPFAHPILGSLQLAFFLPLYLLTPRIGPARRMGLAASFLGVFTVSSAGLMSLVLGAALVMYDYLQRRSRDLGWPILLWSLTGLALVLHFISEGGLISVIFRYLTFDPSTGYQRTLIWQFASRDVERSPVLGIGFEEFTRPGWMISSSVDAHWLLVALQFGIPALALLAGATIWSVVHAGRAARRYGRGRIADRNVAVGLAIALAILILSMFSVALWGQSYCFFALFVGVGVGLGTKRRRPPAAGAPPQQAWIR